MSGKKIAEIILNLFFSVIAIAALIIASKYTDYTATRLGAKTFPFIVSILLIIFASLNILRALIVKTEKSNSSAGGEEDTPFSDTAPDKFILRHRVIIAILLSFIYYFLNYIIGFIISTLIFIPLMLYILEYRRPVFMVIITVSATAFLVISFKVLLGVPLPLGMVFE
jgi:hypothetical protein